MKFAAVSIFLLSSTVTAYLSSPTRSQHVGRSNSLSFGIPAPRVGARGTPLFLESDFASAMPDKPEVTKREFLEQAAENCLASVRGSLGDGVDPVPELAALEKLVADEKSGEEDLSVAIYELMIERGMTYDEDPDTGVLTPTNFDIKANLDVPEVMAEFAYLYKYGMGLISEGLVSTDNIKKVVTERLIERTGKTPAEFDLWLGF